MKKTQLPIPSPPLAKLPSSTEKVIKEERNEKAKIDPRDSIYDEDDIPISQCMKKTGFPNPSSSLVKEKVFKKKVLVVNKKTSSPTKLKGGKFPPGSGEGQKWTTLEHSGVIFPSPYKPHGVKIIYNGNLVDLSLEEEEVRFYWTVSFQSSCLHVLLSFVVIYFFELLFFVFLKIEHWKCFLTLSYVN